MEKSKLSYTDSRNGECTDAFENAGSSSKGEKFSNSTGSCIPSTYAQEKWKHMSTQKCAHECSEKHYSYHQKYENNLTVHQPMTV